MTLRTPLLALLLLAAAGCDRPSAEVRTYVDRTVSNPPARMPPFAGGMGDPHGGGPAAGGPAPSALPALDLKWDAPAEWTVKPASGFRLATLEIPSGDAKLECILSQLGPEAGEPTGNVGRWIGQLGVPPPEAAALAEFCQALPSFETPAGWKGRMIDLKPFAKDTSMLAAIVVLPDRTLFSKLTGPVAELDRLRPAFETLCKSLH